MTGKDQVGRARQSVESTLVVRAQFGAERRAQAQPTPQVLVATSLGVRLAVGLQSAAISS